MVGIAKLRQQGESVSCRYSPPFSGRCGIAWHPPVACALRYTPRVPDKHDRKLAEWRSGYARPNIVMTSF